MSALLKSVEDLDGSASSTHLRAARPKLATSKPAVAAGCCDMARYVRLAPVPNPEHVVHAKLGQLIAPTKASPGTRHMKEVPSA